MTSQAACRSYRVVQWATGNIGTRSLRAVIEHPILELAGLYVTNPAKVGKDAGELCGLKPTGVKATNKIEDVLAAKPDCVLYMQQGFNADDVCRLLEAGINIVTTRDEVEYAPAIEPQLRARIEAACAKGKSSIHATGSSPGFINEALPLPLLQLSRRLDHLIIDEYADCSSRNSPEMLFEVMGFGQQPSSERGDGSAQHLRHAFGPSLRLLGDAVGLPLDDVVAKAEFGLATEDIHIAAGVVNKGSIAAMRISIDGMRGGKPLMTQRLNWYIGTQIDQKGWDLRASGWRVQVLGDAPLDVSITFPVKPEDYAAFTPGLTAHPAVNAVPYVVDAAPGLRSSLDLPRIAPRY